MTEPVGNSILRGFRVLDAYMDGSDGDVVTARDEWAEAKRELVQMSNDCTRYRATLQKVAERSLAIPGVREVITSLGEGLSSDG